MGLAYATKNQSGVDMALKEEPGNGLRTRGTMLVEGTKELCRASLTTNFPGFWFKFGDIFDTWR